MSSWKVRFIGDVNQHMNVISAFERNGKTFDTSAENIRMKMVVMDDIIFITTKRLEKRSKEILISSFAFTKSTFGLMYRSFIELNNQGGRDD